MNLTQAPYYIVIYSGKDGGRTFEVRYYTHHVVKSFDTLEAAQAELERRLDDHYADALEAQLSRSQGW
jgi:hypothetical protein